MIKDEITLDPYEQDELCHLSDVAIDTILYIAKDLICKNGICNVTCDDIQQSIQENWG